MQPMGKKPKLKAGSTPMGDEESQVNYENQVRFEIRKLKRQFRMMEHARNNIAGASSKLSNQGRQVTKLRDENASMLADIESLRSKAIKSKDKFNFETIEDTVERFEKLKEEIAALFADLLEMESSVDKITQQLVEQKLRIQAEYGQSMTVAESDRRKRILEDRLYLLTTQFDTLVYQNKQFKEEINTLMILRGLFFKKMVVMQRLTAQLRTRMQKILDETKQAYKTRDEYISEMNMLVKRNSKEIKKHVFDIKELQRVLLQDYKVRDFLLKKNKLRNRIETEAHRAIRKNKLLNDKLDALLAAYKKSFKAVLKMANSNDLATVVNQYVDVEQRNYSDFRFVMDLNQDINKVEEDVSNVKEEIEELSKISKAQTKEQEDSIGMIDKRIEIEIAENEEALVKLQEAEDRMGQFGQIVDECFKIVGCSKADVTGLLGEGAGMQPHNICLCLKAMDRKMTELIFEQQKLKIRKSVEIDGNPLPKKPQLWEKYKEPEPRGGPFKSAIFITGAMQTDQDNQEGQDMVGKKAWNEEPIYYENMKTVIKHKAATAAPSVASIIVSRMSVMHPSRQSMYKVVQRLTNPETQTLLAGPSPSAKSSKRSIAFLNPPEGPPEGPPED